jgi:hypothetical protein
MRFLLAGVLILALPASAWAQARGQVLSLGFNNRYRPDCWTPMLVQLTSQSPDSQVYQIQIVQEDLDRDRVTYTQNVTLGGNVEGRPPTTENFWVYFKPKPVDDGLPDATDLGATLATLNSELKIYLCDKDGKQLSTLPLTATIFNVDPKHQIGEPNARGRRLILFVSDGTDQPEISDFSQQKGVLQDVEAVTIAPRDLPGNVIGYEAVDAIVWLDADANLLTSGTHTPSLEALMQWIHQGGNLVVCEPPEAVKIKPFEDILPVKAQVNGLWTIPMSDRSDLDVLNRLAHPNSDTAPWPSNMGSFKVARVPALPDAKVDEWITWKDGENISFTPWLARRAIGLGAVTWVAQDLGNAALTRQATSGWRYVWERVFDWNDPSNVSENYKPEADKADLWPQTDKALDVGEVLSEHHIMDLTGTAAVLLAIAAFFFIIYWIVAGPGIYLILAARKQAKLSWFMFALTAVAATALTAALVRLVVRGPPKLQHVSFVRYATGEPDGIIDSRFGLYIREDGLEKISLLDTAPHEVSYLTPYSMPPSFVESSEELPAYLEYQIAVPEGSKTGEVTAEIPYRSTMKKLQTHWVGQMKGTIDLAIDTTALKLDANNKLVGTLVNHTGYDLWQVFLGIKRPAPGSQNALSSQDVDTIVYVQKWAKNDSLQLDDLLSTKRTMNLDSPDKNKHPMQGVTLNGDMGLVTDGAGSWSTFWRSGEDDLATDLDYALPMLTFFDQFPPWAEQADPHSDRYEIRRYGARMLDLSPALSAGSLVICGRATVNDDPTVTPLPVSLTVSDSPVQGQGTTFYQFVMPVDRSAASGPPTTQPSGQ